MEYLGSFTFTPKREPEQRVCVWVSLHESTGKIDFIEYGLKIGSSFGVKRPAQCITAMAKAALQFAEQEIAAVVIDGDEAVEVVEPFHPITVKPFTHGSRELAACFDYVTGMVHIRFGTIRITEDFSHTEANTVMQLAALVALADVPELAKMITSHD